MPIYDYACLACGHRFEKLAKARDAPQPDCPACGGPVKKTISSRVGIILKGEGGNVASHDASGSPKCGKETSCCGKEVPCEKRPCDG